MTEQGYGKRRTPHAARNLLRAALVLAIGTALGCTARSRNMEKTWPVLRVVDGDTLRVLYAPPAPLPESVRLLNVDAPERGKPGYEEAAEALRRMVEGRRVRLEFEHAGRVERDGFGRLLAYVLVDEVNVNVEMVRQGWGRFFDRCGEGRYAETFRAAENEAREGRRGNWR